MLSPEWVCIKHFLNSKWIHKPIIESLEEQAAERVAEGVERGNPRMIAYVANLVALRGKRPAIEPREDGGPLEPKKTYTINENQKEAVVGKDGSTSTINDGKPATFTATQPGYVLPDYAKGDWQAYTKPDSISPRKVASVDSWDVNSAPGMGGPAFGAPHLDDTPSMPGTLSGPMPVMPRLRGTGKPPSFTDIGDGLRPGPLVDIFMASLVMQGRTAGQKPLF